MVKEQSLMKAGSYKNASPENNNPSIVGKKI